METRRIRRNKTLEAQKGPQALDERIRQLQQLGLRRRARKKAACQTEL